MADNINYLLGAPTYTNEKQQRVATGEGAYGQMEDYMQQYLNRGDWRMAMDQGASSPYGPLQHRDASGVWSDWTNPIVGYDPRQDANTLDSNERRRFNQGFLQGTTGTDLRGDNLQTVAVQNGWKEPSRNDKTTLMSVLRDIAPGVGMVLGGGMLANGLLGAGAAGAGAAEGSGGLSWLGNSGLSSIPEAVSSTAAGVGSGATAGLEGLELGGEGVGQALDAVSAGTPDIGAVTQGPFPSSTSFEHGSLWDQLNPQFNPNQTFAPWANADPALRVGSPEWIASAGQGSTMANGQLLNLPEWIAANPQSAAALGIDIPWYQRLLNAASDGKSTASSIAKALGLGDTASGLLGLGTKLLSGLDLVRRQRDALNTNDRRLRDSKDATPLSATSFNMLRPTALRRAKGGLAQCAECGGVGGPSMTRYVQGGTSGQSDKIPAMLSDGEYVFDADSVAALGDGNNAAGAAALDQMRQNIRKHKRSAPVHKIPPKAKRPEHYLKGATK